MQARCTFWGSDGSNPPPRCNVLEGWYWYSVALAVIAKGNSNNGSRKEYLNIELSFLGRITCNHFATLDLRNSVPFRLVSYTCSFERKFLKSSLSTFGE